MLNKIIPIVLLLFLASCSSASPIITKTIIELPNIIHPAAPLAPNLVDFKVIVVNKKLLEELAGAADSKTAYIVIDTLNYEVILKDFNELRKYIENQKAIILYYKTILKKDIKE